MRLPPGVTEIEITGSELFVKVLSEPHLCQLLNPNLRPAQLESIKSTFHVVQVEHENKWYDAVVLGYYKPKLSQGTEALKEREAKILDFWIE